MILWVIAVLVVLVLLLSMNVRSSRRPKHASLEIAGKLIWLDKGNTAAFFNKEFYVCGKPDLIYMQKQGILAVEYKPRNGPIYESDIVQAKVAALAARGTSRFRVDRIMIKTGTMEQYIDLPVDDYVLYTEVELYVEMVRTAKTGGQLMASPAVPKCRSCGYRTPCARSVV